MTKMRTASSDIASVYTFFCPGCKTLHGFTVYKHEARGWTFNGDMEKPTFTPSLLVYPVPKINQPRCHLFLTNGELNYCADSDHDHAGRTVPLPPLPKRGSTQ